MKSSEVLSSLDLSKGSNASEEGKAYIAEHLKNFRLEIAGVPLEISAEQQEAITELIENQCEWMEEVLGLSARQKVEALGLDNKIKFFHPEEWEKITTQFPHERVLKGLNLAPQNVILLEKEENQPEASSLAVLNHEITHALSRQKLRIHEEGSNLDIAFKLYGYKNAANQVFSYFNEIITESINLETLVYLHRNKGKSLLGSINQAYKRGMILLTMIIDRLATSTGRDAADIRLDLYRAYFTGDYSILKMFNQALGRDALRVLADMPLEAEDSSETLRGLGEKSFGLNGMELEKRMKDFDEGRGVEILSGVTWKKNLATN